MADSLYLIDSNILIRWVQQDDPDYQVVESALNVLAGKKRFSATHPRTSLNFGMHARVRRTAMDMG